MRKWRPLTASASDVWRVLVVIMVCYYRSFCKSFSAVATPLTDLLSPKRSFVWTEESQLAFESVKALLTTFPVLAAPNFSLEPPTARVPP